MFPNCVQADPENLRDLLIGLAGGDPEMDFGFTRRERPVAACHRATPFRMHLQLQYD